MPARLTMTRVNRDVARIIDANLNRTREGLRVLEEYARFVLNDEAATRRIKQMRHDAAAAAGVFPAAILIDARDTPGDAGTRIATEGERQRGDAAAVARAAAGRIGESLRSLEEYAKIGHRDAATEFERIRYECYTIEQLLFAKGPRRLRLRQSLVHVLLTESLCRGEWLDVAMAALTGGADVIQLREKMLPDRELLARAKRLVELTRRHDALLIVNDRADIARLADADGVHLGQDDLPVQAARHLLGPAGLVGKSTHSVDEATSAWHEGPDYIGVGPMFASGTKAGLTPAGPALLRRAAEALAQPEGSARGGEPLVLTAIGGITEHNAGQVAAAVYADAQRGRRDGAAAIDQNAPIVQIAVCQSVIAAEDPAEAVRRLRNAFAPAPRSGAECP